MQDSRPIFDASVTNVVELAQKGYTRLTSAQVINGNASVVYLQLFNAASAADVTLGTTPPDQALKIEASVAPFFDFSNPPRFSLGLCYAITTTSTGATAAGSASSLNLCVS